MTIKTITSIELSDVQAVEFECEGCHSKVSYPLDKFTHPLTICNTCKPERQFIVYGSTEFAEWIKFVELLKRFSKKNSNFAFRLELTSALDREVNDRV